MQAQLFLVGSIPTAIDGSASSSSSSSTSRGGHNSPTRSWSRHRKCSNKSRHHKKKNKRGPTVVVASSSSSWVAFNGGEQDHYAVLGLERTATSADIKKAYRLLARKYHPDVSKNSQACELFKSVRHAYEILFNEVTRARYDRALRFQEDTSRSYSKRQYYTPEVEDWARIYKRAEMKQKMRSGHWEHYNVREDPSFYSGTEEEAEEGSLDQERGPFSEVLRSAFLSLFLLQTLGSLSSLTFSSLMALFDRQLDAGYKIGYFIAWILGGRGGILLVLCLQFASWACGKTSSSTVALVAAALCVGSNLARFAPRPQGALVTLLYMSIKLQADLN
ncbi:PREDICTED: J domain-containing protein DDB_G0295729-like isoform X2 [Populus euphratica]|uniref:J domain-containing protein DDB_G0295729-like isoform X1 n=1 Tax=Populus euphratica TaxID=75702 RepID=A0AAJ6XJP8_POPEU|nr:PREDICTED: J domain-containing protein DDB_G0295729-like isoform X1 [Populus euphratica]XP_011021478.1 PREDICTED: J domain-containing protein DDB_G0295729-like isoform X2 [Populus euphratica]